MTVMICAVNVNADSFAFNGMITKYFGAAEHADIGLGISSLPETTVVSLPEDDGTANPDPPSRTARTNASLASLTFTNGGGISLSTYGDLIAINGDFFGASDTDEVICSGSSLSDRKTRFTTVFNQLWSSTDSSYIEKILDQVRIESEALVAAISAAGGPANFNGGYQVYHGLGDLRFANVVRMVYLAFYNHDHFSSCARSAYEAAHTVAMETAQSAGSVLRDPSAYSALSNSEKRTAITTAKEGLKKALVMNSFADHFLTDLFASGHIRTPRAEIATACGSTLTGSLTGRRMHDEDNRNGLRVRNARGDVWWAFGDNRLFDAQNAENAAMVKEASYLSRFEVVSAFDTGVVVSSPQPLQLIPRMELSADLAIHNTCPLYRMVNGQLEVRDPQDVLRSPAGLAGTGALVANADCTNDTAQSSTSGLELNCTFVAFDQDTHCSHALEALPIWDAELVCTPDQKGFVSFDRFGNAAAFGATPPNMIVLTLVCILSIILSKHFIDL
jgi:hypothetical protein